MLHDPASAVSTDPPEVAMVTVTYGDRAATCLTIVERAFEQGVARVVIVDNGSVASSAGLLDAFAARHDDCVSLVRLASNAGSAAGYSRAIDVATALDQARIWLLDDDNLPEPGALDALRAGESALRDAGVRRPAVACVRLDDPLQVAVAGGADADAVLGGRATFFGFDLWRRFSRHVPARPRSDAAAGIEVPWVPYGGLLIDRSALQDAGRPNPTFVLYGDDRDYCARLAEHGVRFFLVPDAQIRDVIERWDVAETQGGNLQRIVRSADQRRAYYLLRNTIFLEARSVDRIGQRIRFAVNGLVFSAAALATAARLRRARFARTYVRAVVHALRPTWFRA